MNDGNAPGTPPEGRPNQYKIGMSESAIGAVMSSPVILGNLTTQIINNCDSVNSVSYGAWQSDWIQVYGLMPNDEVKIFECPEVYFAGNENRQYRDLVWGKHCSL